MSGCPGLAAVVVAPVDSLGVRGPLPHTVLSDAELAAASECARAANGVVMALFEVQNKSMTADQRARYVDSEAIEISGTGLLRGLAYLPGAYVQIAANLMGRTPQEMIGLQSRGPGPSRA